MNSGGITFNQIHQENQISIVTNNNGVLISSVLGTGYQWYVDNSPIAGENSFTFSPSESGDYFVKVFFVNGCPTISEPYTFEFLATQKSFTTLDRFFLHQNYPNPFNPTTSINYKLLQNHLVNITIFDMNGKIIKNLLNDFQYAGNHSIIWNGADFKGSKVSAGLYLCVLQVGNIIQTRKMLFIK